MSAQWFSAAAPVARHARAYFAPVDRAAQAPVTFDPSCQGRFDLDAPPAPWIGLGLVQGFTRTSTGKSGAVMTGIPAAPLEQVRETLDAEVTFQFVNWTKLTMALATGSQHMNLLNPANDENLVAIGGEAVAAVAVQEGSTSTSIVLAPGDASMFPAGTMVAVDDDCTGQTGFVGSPVCGAYLRQPLSDVDYLRRVTFNLGVVAKVSQDTLVLAEPLPGGAPAASAKLQAVCGFVDRIGGSFFHEWSGLFVMEGSQGERVFFHYPRLLSVKDGEESAMPLSGKGKGSLERVLLKAQCRALPVTDPIDGERVLCYRSFLPAPSALG
jgi:hypothetical protein